jgi:hypothetical protein
MSLSPAEQKAQTSLLAVERGKTVVVARGPRGKRGVKGIVFWMGDKGYGPRIGFHNSLGNAVWAHPSHVDVVLDGVPLGQKPSEGWVAASLKSVARKAAWLATFPKKGEKVRHLESKTEGKVFWAQEERIGMKRGEDEPIWCQVWEVEVFRDGAYQAVPSHATGSLPPPPPSKIPAKPPIKVTPTQSGFFDLDLEDDDELDDAELTLKLLEAHQTGVVSDGAVVGHLLKDPDLLANIASHGMSESIKEKIGDSVIAFNQTPAKDARIKVTLLKEGEEEGEKLTFVLLDPEILPSEKGEAKLDGTKGPLDHYPPPFNQIAEVRRVECSIGDTSEFQFNAHDTNGVFILRLTEESAKAITALLLE